VVVANTGAFYTDIPGLWWTVLAGGEAEPVVAVHDGVHAEHAAGRGVPSTLTNQYYNTNAPDAISFSPRTRGTSAGS
jgi:hypothetical protein